MIIKANTWLSSVSEMTNHQNFHQIRKVDSFHPVLRHGIYLRKISGKILQCYRSLTSSSCVDLMACWAMITVYTSNFFKGIFILQMVIITNYQVGQYLV